MDSIWQVVSHRLYLLAQVAVVSSRAATMEVIVEGMEVVDGGRGNREGGRSCCVVG